MNAHSGHGCGGGSAGGGCGGRVLRAGRSPPPAQAHGGDAGQVDPHDAVLAEAERVLQELMKADGAPAGAPAAAACTPAEVEAGGVSRRAFLTCVVAGCAAAATTGCGDFLHTAVGKKNFREYGKDEIAGAGEGARGRARRSAWART